MTFAKQWTDAQVADLAERCARKLKADRTLVHRVVHWMLGEGIGLTLKVLGSAAAPHGTLSGSRDWGCECDPCEDAWEREEKRMEEQAERIRRTERPRVGSELLAEIDRAEKARRRRKSA